jgi:hypothetical protein
MSRIASVAALGAAAVWLLSCVVAPKLDGAANVPLNAVVKRIKCDLVSAVQTKSHQDSRFQFLTQWAAKVHLTVVVDDTGSINPGATFIEPLKVAGTSRSLGVGGGFTAQAVRQEDIEFFLAFPTIISELHSAKTFNELYNGCPNPEGILLESDLDLLSIFDKALGPVGEGTLYKGPQSGIGAGGPSAIPPGEVANIRQSLEQLRAIHFPQPAPTDARAFKESNPDFAPFLDKVEKDLGNAAAATIASNITEARRLERDTKSVVTNIVTPLFDIASTENPICLPAINGARAQSVTWATVVSLRKIDVDRAKTDTDSTKALTDEKAAQDKAIDFAKKMVGLISDCPAAAKKPPPGPALYDPIDLIGETVNFYITLTGSVTPTWKLVRVTAPLAPTFASAIRKDTNTLILTLGRPAYQDGKVAGPSSAMSQQMLTSILSQAFANRPVIP